MPTTPPASTCLLDVTTLHTYFTLFPTYCQLVRTEPAWQAYREIKRERERIQESTSRIKPNTDGDIYHTMRESKQASNRTSHVDTLTLIFNPPLKSRQLLVGRISPTPPMPATAMPSIIAPRLPVACTRTPVGTPSSKPAKKRLVGSWIRQSGPVIAKENISAAYTPGRRHYFGGNSALKTA